METSQPIALNPLDQLHAATVLAHAFHDDPGTRYIFDDTERAKALPTMFAPMVAYGLAHGTVQALGEPARAVAIWLPPEKPAPDPESLGNVGMGEAIAGWSSAARKRSDHLVGYLEMTRTRLMAGPHARLFFLGVEPASQGIGLGAALIDPMLRTYHERNVACYLETLKEGNVGFYERRGFRVLEESTLPETSVRVWAMRSL